MIKTITTIILIFTTFFTFGKGKCVNKIDKLTFDYINMYRKANKVNKIKWSDELYVVSQNQSNKLMTYNLDKTLKDNSIKLFHSNTNTYENCLGSGMFNDTITVDADLNKFIKKYFKVKDLTSVDYKALNLIYTWHKSSHHKKNLLRKDVKTGSVSYKQEKTTVLGNELFIYFATCNLK